jgi:hypothetical protein
MILLAPLELERYDRIVAALDRPAGLPQLHVSGSDIQRWHAAVRLGEKIITQELSDARKRSDARWISQLAKAADCDLDETTRREFGIDMNSDEEVAFNDDHNERGASSKQKKKRRRKMKQRMEEATTAELRRQLANALDRARRSMKKSFALPTTSDN